MYTLAVDCKNLGVFITLCVKSWPVSIFLAVTRNERVMTSFVDCCFRKRRRSRNVSLLNGKCHV